jgi:hypothetical protein
LCLLKIVEAAPGLVQIGAEHRVLRGIQPCGLFEETDALVHPLASAVEGHSDGPPFHEPLAISPQAVSQSRSFLLRLVQ